MSREEIKAVEWLCDGCGALVVMQAYEGEPDGYHGVVREVGSWGGSSTLDWYACRATHIRRAVEAVLERERLG